MKWKEVGGSPRACSQPGPPAREGVLRELPTAASSPEEPAHERSFLSLSSVTYRKPHSKAVSH